MKKTKVIIPIIFIALILVIVGFFLLSPQKYTVALYNIGERQQKGLEKALTQIAQENSLSIQFIQYDSEKKLSSQIPFAKKPAIIFTSSGFAVESAIGKASKKAALPKELSKGFTSSMTGAVKQSGEGITALPVLSGHFELDIDTQEFKKSKVTKINTWGDVKEFMIGQKTSNNYPMVLAGANPDFFLDFVGAVAESLDGADSYKEAVKIIAEVSDPAKAANALCDKASAPLASTVALLKDLYKFGLIHPGSFAFTNADIEAMALNRQASVLFMSLENHRDMTVNSISHYSSSYIPSEHGANARVFTGKIYYAVPMYKSAQSEKLLTALVSKAQQEQLSQATGIAPVLKQSRTPDKQSDDARFWIAATTVPLAGLSNEVFLTKEAKITLAAEIASRIRN